MAEYIEREAAKNVIVKIFKDERWLDNEGVEQACFEAMKELNDIPSSIEIPIRRAMPCR